MSLSSDGRKLAIGGPSNGGSIGATWIYIFDGTTYRQLGPRLVGSGASGVNIFQGKITQENVLSDL